MNIIIYNRIVILFRYENLFYTNAHNGFKYIWICSMFHISCIFFNSDGYLEQGKDFNELLPYIFLSLVKEGTVYYYYTHSILILRTDLVIIYSQLMLMSSIQQMLFTLANSVD